MVLARSEERLPIIWTASVTRLSGVMREVTPEFDGRAIIHTINLGFEEAVQVINERLRGEDCDVVISAGSNGAYLKNRIDKPIVLIRPSGFDLMVALARARRLAPRVGVVTYGAGLPALTAFQQQFGLEVEQRAYTTTEDARDAVAELLERGCGALVGTGFVVDLADRHGVPGVLLYSTDSIREAFAQAIDLAAMLKRSTPSLRRLSESPRARAGAQRLLGDGPRMSALREQLRLYGASNRTVLITGETGTGKELAAQALHDASPRANGPMVAVNCGAIAESLLEAELFGHEDGAFTGSRRGGRIGLIEAASGGTLFLDEIGEMPLTLQTRLLRVLEEREVLRVGSVRATPVDLRVIAATHCDLDADAASGRFRRDLFYRLNVLRVNLPPLRERGDDIAQLMGYFLRAAGADGMVIDEAALQVLRRHRWPGNVRELRNLAERVATLLTLESPLAALTRARLQQCAPELFALRDEGEAPPSPPAAPRRARPTPAQLRDMLADVGGRQHELARRLGVSRTTLWRWLGDAS